MIADLRRDLLAIVQSAIGAADAGMLVTHALARDPRSADDTPVWLVAAGKAAPAMAGAAMMAVGTRVRGGVVIGPAAAAVPSPLRSLVGEHPEPGQGSEAAGRAARDVARHAPPNSRLLVLLSGGASSLMAVPAAGISLEEKRRATATLLRAGADIRAFNTVRKHLSAIKGGWLAATSAAGCRTLAVSDVVGDDLSVIASGPTVADPTTFAEARGVLQRLGGLDAYPSAVVERIEAGLRGEHAETPKPGDSRLARSEASVVGGRFDAMRGAEAEARTRGYEVLMIDEPLVGESRVTARRHVTSMLTRASALPGLSRPLCVVSSGETTVTVKGRGRGGRNQEFALAVVDTLANAGRTLALASVGTDGVDGPTDAAGAIVEATTLRRARSAGLADPETYLTSNDSYTFFAATGDLIRTGRTGTNVGDLQVFLIL